MQLSPIPKTRVSQHAVRQIEEFVRHSGLRPGARLPSERQLMAEFRISRTPVREALRVLEIMGVIEVRPGSGAYIVDPDGGIFLPMVRARLARAVLAQRHYEARLAIEPGLAALAAERAGPEDRARIARALDEFSQNLAAKNVLGAVVAEANFHRAVAQATHNEALQFALDALSKYLELHTQDAGGGAKSPTGRASALGVGEWRSDVALFLFVGLKQGLDRPGRLPRAQEHRAVLDAIVRRDPAAAAAAMRRHLTLALADLAKVRAARLPATARRGGDPERDVALHRAVTGTSKNRGSDARRDGTL